VNDRTCLGSRPTLARRKIKNLEDSGSPKNNPRGGGKLWQGGGDLKQGSKGITKRSCSCCRPTDNRVKGGLEGARGCSLHKVRYPSRGKGPGKKGSEGGRRGILPGAIVTRKREEDSIRRGEI